MKAGRPLQVLAAVLGLTLLAAAQPALPAVAAPARPTWTVIWSGPSRPGDLGSLVIVSSVPVDHSVPLLIDGKLRNVVFHGVAAVIPISAAYRHQFVPPAGINTVVIDQGPSILPIHLPLPPLTNPAASPSPRPSPSSNPAPTPSPTPRLSPSPSPSPLQPPKASEPTGDYVQAIKKIVDPAGTAVDGGHLTLDVIRCGGSVGYAAALACIEAKPLPTPEAQAAVQQVDELVVQRQVLKVNGVDTVAVNLPGGVELVVDAHQPVGDLLANGHYQQLDLPGGMQQAEQLNLPGLVSTDEKRLASIRMVNGDATSCAITLCDISQTTTVDYSSGFKSCTLNCTVTQLDVNAEPLLATDGGAALADAEVVGRVPAVQDTSALVGAAESGGVLRTFGKVLQVGGDVLAVVSAGIYAYQALDDFLSGHYGMAAAHSADAVLTIGLAELTNAAMAAAITVADVVGAVVMGVLLLTVGVVGPKLFDCVGAGGGGECFSQAFAGAWKGVTGLFGNLESVFADIFEPDIYVENSTGAPVHLSLSVPPLGAHNVSPPWSAGRWDVTSLPDGRVDAGAGPLPSLHYELNSGGPWQTRTGWVVPRSQFVAWVERTLPAYGFGPESTAGFIRTWGGLAQGPGSIAVYPQDSAILDAVEPLQISGAPVSVRREWFLVAPVPVNLPALPTISPAPKGSLDVQEWGMLFARPDLDPRGLRP